MQVTQSVSAPIGSDIGSVVSRLVVRPLYRLPCHLLTCHVPKLSCRCMQAVDACWLKEHRKRMLNAHAHGNIDMQRYPMHISAEHNDITIVSLDTRSQDPVQKQEGQCTAVSEQRMGREEKTTEKLQLQRGETSAWESGRQMYITGNVRTAHQASLNDRNQSVWGKLPTRNLIGR